MNNKNNKSGFVSIIGKPNVGKSSLINLLINKNISIITYKSQTTRNKIIGIFNKKNLQIIYIDTPGIIIPKYLFQNFMMKSSSLILKNTDIALVVIDVYQKYSSNFFRIFLKSKYKLLLINKIDLIKKIEINKIIKYWNKKILVNKIITISIIRKINIKSILKNIINILPKKVIYYSSNTITNQSVNFFICEIIRKKILLNYNKEIPYSTIIEVKNFKEYEKIIKINIEINIERKKQKKIIIGKNGKLLKKIGIESRKEIEKFFKKKVFLEQKIKILNNWKNKKIFN